MSLKYVILHEKWKALEPQMALKLRGVLILYQFYCLVRIVVLLCGFACSLDNQRCKLQNTDSCEKKREEEVKMHLGKLYLKIRKCKWFARPNNSPATCKTPNNTFTVGINS